MNSSQDIRRLNAGGSYSEAAECTRTQDMLSRLAQRASAVSNPEFYRECVRDVASYYDARIITVSLFADIAHTRMRTLLYWIDGEFQDNIEYQLSGTPCQTVLDSRQQYVPEKVTDLYPRDAFLAEMGIESYFGVPLGEPYSNGPGLISIMDDKPMNLSEDQQSVLRVFATRIAAELIWQQRPDQQNRQDLEHEVAMLSKDLSVAYSELGGLYDVISHDLRVPLRSLCGFSEAVLQELGEQDPESLVANYCQRIHKASQRMDQQIEALAHLRRVSSTQLMRTPVNLSRLVEEVVASVRESWRYEHEVHCVVEPDLRVDADRYLLKELVTQLIDNAWKFTTGTRNPRVQVYREIQGSEEVYVFEDNGVGFDMRYANKLFALFHKLHHDIAYEGNGIGLALAHRVVRRHGGNIWAQSRIGEGSKFSITLPPDPSSQRSPAAIGENRPD